LTLLHSIFHSVDQFPYYILFDKFPQHFPLSIINLHSILHTLAQSPRNISHLDLQKGFGYDHETETEAHIT